MSDEQTEYRPYRIVRTLVNASPKWRRIIYRCPNCGDIECQLWKRKDGDKRSDESITDRCLACVRKFKRKPK
jgi:hypothetical protein